MVVTLCCYQTRSCIASCVILNGEQRYRCKLGNNAVIKIKAEYLLYTAVTQCTTVKHTCTLKLYLLFVGHEHVTMHILYTNAEGKM